MPSYSAASSILFRRDWDIFTVVCESFRSFFIAEYKVIRGRYMMMETIGTSKNIILRHMRDNVITRLCLMCTRRQNDRFRFLC